MNKNIFNHKKNKNEYSKDDKYKFKKPIYVKDDMEILNRLLKKYTTTKKSNQKTSYVGGWRKGTAYKFKEQNQRVSFKMSYSKLLTSHENYIKHYMPQENKDYVKEKPLLFGISDEVYEANKVPLNFKCIISPESQDINLETLVESYIRRVEEHTGYKLCWKGCIHEDTNHRHAHVIINGKDLNGEEIYFNKDTIQLMRLMCSNAATQMIGERTKEQIEIAKKKYVKAKRWTELDEKIVDLLNENYIERKGLLPEIDNRLAYLSELKLSELDKENGYWKISNQYRTVLTSASRYNTFLEEYVQNPEEELELYTGGYIKGRVEKVITFDKDEAWNDAIIIRTNDKKVYVPVWQLHKDDLQGKYISISKKGDETKISRQISDKDIFVRE